MRVKIIAFTAALCALLGMPLFSAAEDEKLLLGFEPAELAKIGGSGGGGDSSDWIAPGGDKRQYGYGKYLIKKGNSTQGEYICAHDYKEGGGGTSAGERSDGWKKELARRAPGLYEKYGKYGKEYAAFSDYLFEFANDFKKMATSTQKPLLYTLNWFPKAFPKDWSGYDVLRVDAMSTAADVSELYIGVEDDYVDPMVFRIYAFPAGKWATLEFDLKEAAEKKHLDPAHMVNILILAMRFKDAKPKATTVALDNIRLAKKGAGKTQGAALPGAFWAYPDNPKVTVEKPKMEGTPPDTSPITQEPPIVIQTGGNTDLNITGARGVISAYDNNRMILGYAVKDSLQLKATTDGGKTWNGLIDGSDKGVAVRLATGDPGQGGANARGASYDFYGVVQNELYGGYCQGDFLSPRHWYRGVTFNGKTWEMGPFTLVTSEARHCYSRTAVLTLDSGRIWTMVDLPSRHEYNREVHIKYSDDGGLTWQGWRGPGLSGKIDGSEGAKGGSSGGDRWDHLAPFGEHAACFFLMQRGGPVWSYYDGKSWRKAEPIGCEGPVLSAATLKDKEVFVSTDKGVFKYNGNSWAKEGGAKGGYLAVAGKENILLFDTWEAGKIAYQQRKGGSWSAPKVVAEEPGFKRAWRNFGVPQYSPPNFVPIAWSSPTQVKVLKVPVE